MPLVYRDRNKHSGHRGPGPEKKGEGSDGPDVEPLTGKRIRDPILSIGLGYDLFLQ